MPSVTNQALGANQAPVLNQTRTLAQADILALKTTPFTLIPAPAASQIIVVFGMALAYHFGTVAYDRGSGVERFQYNEAGNDAVIVIPTTDIFAAAASKFYYAPGSMIDIAAVSPGVSGVAVVLGGSPDFNFGAIASSTLGAAGTGYAANDTGTITTGNGDATYKILTVGALGVVLTYQITAAGTGYAVGNGQATATGGGQPGVGVGFTVNVTAITPGDGTLKVTSYYQIVTAP